MRRITIAAAIFLVLTCLAAASAAQNQVDLSFAAAPSVTNSAFKQQIVQPDGKVIVWGGALTANGQIKGLVARLNTNGSVDTSFNFCNCNLYGVSTVALQSDGKLLVGGEKGFPAGTLAGAMIRVNSDGSLDTSYEAQLISAPSFFTMRVRLIIMLPGGKSLVLKDVLPISGASQRLVDRHNADGSVDGTFTQIDVAGGISYDFADMAVAPDGKIYIAKNRSGSPARLDRYNSDGTVDGTFASVSFASTTGGTLSSIDVQPDGNVLAAGNFTTVNGLGKIDFARVLSAGSVDVSFNPPGTVFTSGSQIKTLASGKILVIAELNSTDKDGIFRLNSDGSMDSVLSESSGEVTAKARAVLDETAKMNGERDAGIKGGDFVQTPSVDEVLNKFALDSTEQVVFFGKSSTGGLQYFRIDPLGNLDAGFNTAVGDFGTVGKVARQSDGKIIVAGAFSEFNGVTHPTLVRVNTDGSLDAGFDPGTGFSGIGNVFFTKVVVQPDNKILVMGEFTSYNGVSRSTFVRINADGSLDTSFIQTTRSGGVLSSFALQSDGKIVVGGGFTSFNGTAHAGLARLNSDGTLDTGFNPTLGSTGLSGVTGIFIQPDGKIIIGGRFNGVNGFSRQNIARLNADGTLDASFNAGALPILSHYALAPDGKLLVFFPDNQVTDMLRLNSDGSQDISFPTGKFVFSSDQRINDVAFKSNGEFFVAGNFLGINGVSKRSLAWFNPNGRVNRLLLPGNIDEEITGLVTQADDKLVIGGIFRRVNGNHRPGLARVETTNFNASTLYDFDGDGRSDISIFRPADGNWYLARSSAGFAVNHFGMDGDRPTPADFDGDGVAELAIFRDGAWWYLNSSNGTVGLKFFGGAGDIPFTADLDMDGRDDLIYYRPSTSTWGSLGSMGTIHQQQFGVAGDIPAVGDYDGDGLPDFTIYRPSTGRWVYLSSLHAGLKVEVQWGLAGDIPIPADYTGDGKTDIAVYRPSTGVWYIIDSANSGVLIYSWGLAEDRPVPGDYDGDGKADIAVWRPSNGVWFIIQSTAGFTGMQYGLPADKAVPSSYYQ